MRISPLAIRLLPQTPARATTAPLTRFALLVVLACAAVLAPGRDARADDTIRHPGDHPSYRVELEPHGLFGWGGPYGTDGGFGLGGRFGIPIVHNGFIPTINNSVAISFGLDWIHYGGCYTAFLNCSADYLESPVTMQWNFYVSEHWSVFGEPGFYIFKGWVPNCGNYIVNGVRYGCNYDDFGVRPAFFAGARYHFSDKAALTMRVGFPSLSIGVSFFP